MRERRIRQKMDRRKRKKQRYGEYMRRQYEQRWNQIIKRVEVLKKDLEDLGSAPNNERQLIKTLKYLKSLVNITTRFAEEGLIDLAYEEKAKAVFEFNETILIISARERENGHYINKTKVGEEANFSNLLIGRFEQITEEQVTPKMKTKQIGEILYKVEVEYTPIVKWLNFPIVSSEKRYVFLSQKKLAIVCEQLKEMLLEVIEDVLK